MKAKYTYNSSDNAVQATLHVDGYSYTGDFQPTKDDARASAAEALETDPDMKLKMETVGSSMAVKRSREFMAVKATERRERKQAKLG